MVKGNSKREEKERRKADLFTGCDTKNEIRDVKK